MSDEQLPADLNAAQQLVLKALDLAFDTAMSGGPGVDSAPALAENFLRDNKGDVEAAIDNLISWQVGKAGMTGFVTNIGGLITLPVALPANLATVLFLQLRMVATIAVLRGYDLKSEQVKVVCMGALLGKGLTDLMKEAGVQIGTKLAKSLIMRIPGDVLLAINRTVGFRLATKAGTTGAINLVKIIPFVGGVIAGGVDALGTKSVAEAAKLVFTPVGQDSPPTIDAEPVPA